MYVCTYIYIYIILKLLPPGLTTDHSLILLHAIRSSQQMSATPRLFGRKPRSSDGYGRYEAA